MPRSTEVRFVAVVEFEAFKDMRRGVQVTLSLPGKEGTVRRSWRPREGCAGLSEGQRADFCAWVQTTASNWLLLAFAEQLRWPL